MFDNETFTEAKAKISEPNIFFIYENRVSWGQRYAGLDSGSLSSVNDYEAVYHHQLKRKIEKVFPDIPVSIVNAGIGGENASQGCARLQRDIINCNPDLTVICFGLNDAGSGDAGLPVYRDALHSIFQQLHSREIDTIFMTPNMMCTYCWPDVSPEWLREVAESCARCQNDGMMDQYMAAARDVCQKDKVLLCDCYNDWKTLHALGADVTCLLSNHINHPTREMHGLFAERLFSTLFLRKSSD